MFKEYSKRQKKDFIASVAVFLQTTIVIFQIVLIDVMGVSEESATSIRVAMAAAPMIISAILVLKRKVFAWVFVYAITISVMILHILLFPLNTEIIMAQGLKFTIPMVITSALVLYSVGRLDVIEKALYFVSWLSFFVIIFYVINFFRGAFIIERYSMSFSYGALLPILALYHRKKWYSISAALLIIVVVLAIGSRGAIVAFGVYFIIDTILFNKRFVIPGVIGIAVFFALIPIFSSFLEGFGIMSRTLQLIGKSEVLTYDSGRGEAYDLAQLLILKSPIVGSGIFGDRALLDGYVHNLFYEVWIDYGIIIGSVLLAFFFGTSISTFFRLDKVNKELFMRFFVAGVVPLMVSGSYLTDTSFGIFVGILSIYTMGRRRKKFSAIGSKGNVSKIVIGEKANQAMEVLKIYHKLCFISRMNQFF